MTDHPDAQSIAAVRTGEVDRFRELVERYQHHVYAVAWARLGDEALAEDATQESFIRAYRLLGWLKDPTRFAGWITRITRAVAINLGLKHRRELRRRQRWALDPATFTPPDDTGQVAAVGDPDAGGDISPETLRGALADLPTRHRECLVLFYLEGRTVADAAAALGISEGAFKVRLLRARRALRGHLERRLTESLGRLGPRRSLAPGIMASVLVKSAATDPTGTTAGTAALIAAGLGKLIPLPLLFMLLPIAAATAAVGSQSWAQRIERGNYRDPEGFRRRLYDDDRLRVRHLGAGLAVLAFGLLALAVALKELQAWFIGFVGLGVLAANIAWLRRFPLTRDWTGLIRGMLLAPMLVVFLLMAFYEIPSWMMTATFGLQFLAMLLVPPQRSLRFDQNLFLRARLDLLPAGPSPETFPAAPPFPPSMRWAFARFGADHGLFVAHRRTRQGLQLGLCPVSVEARTWLTCRPGPKDSTVTLFEDGRIEATLGSTDRRHLDRLGIGETAPVATDNRRVASAVRSAFQAFADGDRPAALAALGHLSDDRIFKVAPSRTGFSRVHRLAGILGILVVAVMVWSLRSDREGKLALRAAHLKPVPYTLEDARAITSAVGYGNATYSRHRWDAFEDAHFRGLLLPPADWASLEGRDFLRTNFVPGDLPAIAAQPTRALRLLGDWRSLKALHFGWADAATIEAFREAAPRFREAVATATPGERARLIAPEIHPLANAPGSILELASLRWRLAAYEDLGLLDLFDTRAVVELLRSYQVLEGRPTPPGRLPLDDTRDWLGLFRTRGSDPISDTYEVLVVLNRLRAVDTIDRDACARGLLRLHLGKGLFLTPQTWDHPFHRRRSSTGSDLSVHIPGDARTTFAARESLRLLGALDRVEDLAAWEFRIHSNGTAPSLAHAHLGPEVWSRIEAVLLREASVGDLRLPTPARR